jgi:hypothetical protein
MARTRSSLRQSSLDRLKEKIIGDPKLSHLYAILQDKSSADFAIHFGKSIFLVHKCVLYSFNNYFQTMLSQKWNETTSCVIDPPNDASEEAFEIFLTFAYTRTITDQNIDMFEDGNPQKPNLYFLDLFKLSDYFMEEELKDMIYYMLSEELTADNILHFLDIYQSSSDEKFKWLFTKIIDNNYNYFKRNKNFPLKIFRNDSLLLQTLNKRQEERSELWTKEIETSILENPVPKGKRLIAL